MDYRTKKTYPRRYHPMLVSNSGTDERMDGQTSLKLWEAFDLLPEETRRVVAADEVAEKMKKLQDTFQIEDSAIGKITLLIRRLFFGEINISKMEIEIGNVFAQISPEKINQVKNVVQFIQGEILTIKPQPRRENSEDEAEKQIKIEKLTLEKALLQYPKLGEQSITSNPLKLRYFPTPVRSSIKNWITDYHDCLGAGKHSTMDRGNYLFHSENGKKLTPVERQKVSLLLKSLDEETPLDVDGEEQKIVFTASAETPVKGSQSLAEMPARQTNQFAPVARREELSSRQAISFGQPSVQGARTAEEISQVEKVQTPPQVRSDFSNDFNNKSKQSEDVAQARIRQSLNFSNLQSQQGVKKAEAAKVFDFEDSDYASRLREKISANSTHESDFGTFSINKSNERTEVEPQRQSFGSLSFSSAQELPVEKTATDVSQKLEPSISTPTMESSGGAKTWNSPDFKRQISPAVQLKENQTDSIQGNVYEEQAPKTAQRTYSPYVIVPSSYKEKGDPKIQGNTVDLS